MAATCRRIVRGMVALFDHGRSSVHRSLRARTVLMVVVLALATAIVFSSVSMFAVRGSLLNQAMSQARADFSTLVEKARNTLDSADIAGTAQYQGLVNDLASDLQNDGGSNLIGVYIWGHDTSGDVIPVSTEPTYTSLVSDSLRSSVAMDDNGSVFYQATALPGGEKAVPAAALGTMLEFGAVDGLELFALYSYATEQDSLIQVQMNLMIVSVLLSIMIGALMWWVMRGIVRPVGHVALAAKILADGDLNTRVDVNRNDELGTLQRSFNAMAESLDQKIDELEDASAMQKRFVSDVSHELRTPVTTMRMAADMLESRKENFDAPTKRTVELLSGQIDRFQSLLSDLLEISRYDAGYAALDIVETDIRDPIDDAVSQVAELTRAKNVPLHVYMPNIQVLARVDPRRIIRIVRNLLANAVDFAEDGPIEVQLAANRKALVISVRDYGVGMDPAQLAHVFDRFWRGDPSRARTTGGTGLGLSIAMTDAKLHHGDIAVRSAPGEGTWFLVSLPRDTEAGGVAVADLPIRFADGAGLLIQGSFGVADNGAADYRDAGHRDADHRSGVDI